MKRKPTVKELQEILDSPDGKYKIKVNKDGSLRTIKNKNFVPESPAITRIKQQRKVIDNTEVY